MQTINNTVTEKFWSKKIMSHLGVFCWLVNMFSFILKNIFNKDIKLVPLALHIHLCAGETE